MLFAAAVEEQDVQELVQRAVERVQLAVHVRLAERERRVRGETAFRTGGANNEACAWRGAAPVGLLHAVCITNRERADVHPAGEYGV